MYVYMYIFNLHIYMLTISTLRSWLFNMFSFRLFHV